MSTIKRARVKSADLGWKFGVSRRHDGETIFELTLPSDRKFPSSPPSVLRRFSADIEAVSQQARGSGPSRNQPQDLICGRTPAGPLPPNLVAGSSSRYQMAVAPLTTSTVV